MKNKKHLISFIALTLFTVGALFLFTTPNIQLSPDASPLSLIAPLPTIAIAASLGILIILILKQKNAKKNS